MVTVVLLVLVFFLGGGWYFSGQIEATGLRIEEGGPSHDYKVAAITGSTITLTGGNGDEPGLDGDAYWGIAWDGGYGQVHGPGTGDAGATKEFLLWSGSRPEVGTRIALDRAAFPQAEPRLALDHPVREVGYESELGEMPAWFAGPASGDTWAVLVHGKGEDRAEMLRLMHATVGAGLPSLTIGYRNDGDAPRDPSGQYAFGTTEWEDLADAVEYAEANGAEDVVLVGASMGGAIIASYLEHSPDAPVSRIVLDSPMLDFGATVTHGARQTPLPVLGNVPDALTWTAKQIAATRYDVDWDAVDYLDDSSWLTVPTLVIHGDADPTVPVESSRNLARSHPDLVDLEVVEDATHVASWNQDPQAYDSRVQEFLSR